MIGGLAVEFWTHGAYATGDIDLYLPHGPAVDDLLAELGFEKRGRHWVNEPADLFVEAPASFPAADEEVAEVELSNGARVLLLSAEDMLLYRLEEYAGTGHREAASQAATLLGTEGLDRRRLQRRVEAANLASALVAIEKIRARIAAGETIETWELHEIARGLD